MHQKCTRIYHSQIHQRTQKFSVDGLNPSLDTMPMSAPHSENPSLCLEKINFSRVNDWGMSGVWNSLGDYIQGEISAD